MRPTRLCALLVLAGTFAATGLAQAVNRPASSDSAQGLGNDDSTRPHLDGSGRCVVFQSAADDLVSGDNNSRDDIFLKDFGTGLCERISVGWMGAEPNGHCREARISTNQRWVVFNSRASNLDPFDPNVRLDIYRRDRMLATTTLVSTNLAGVVGNDDSTAPSIDDSGRYVAFSSDADNLLLGGDGNGARDIFVKDLQTGAVILASHTPAGTPGNGPSRNPRISRNGEFVVFDSNANNLVAGDTNGTADVFVFHRPSGAVNRANLGPGATQANGASTAMAISALGTEVLYRSFATNLVAGDTNGQQDVFLSSGIGAWTERISVATGGAEANGASLDGELSGSAQFVVFSTTATNLFANDTNGAVRDIVMRDRVTGITERVADSLLGTAPNGSCDFPVISDNSRFLAFASAATNLLLDKVFVIDDVVRIDRLPPVVATVTTAGPGCPGTHGLSTLDRDAPSLPWIGYTFRMAGSNAPPGGFGICAVGFSNTWIGALPLPLPLGPQGMPGCTLFNSANITFLAFPDGNGDYQVQMPLPYNLLLRGLPLHAQTWLVDPPANALGAIMSNAIDFRIGG